MLLLYANGMSGPAIARVMMVSYETVRSYRKRMMVKLDAPTVTRAVVIAWRRCLIEADEIEGGPMPFRWLTPDEVQEALLNYRQRMRHEPPPTESWRELRERAARIGAEVRAARGPDFVAQRMEPLF